MKRVSFTFLCKELDRNGYYKSADKLERLVKIAQMYGQTQFDDIFATNLPTTGFSDISTGIPIIDSIFNLPADSALGLVRDQTSPIQKEGPDTPFVYGLGLREQQELMQDPQLAAQYAQQTLEDIANYASRGSLPEDQFNAIAQIFSSPGGDVNVKNEQFASLLPVISQNISNDLLSRPLENWSQIVSRIKSKYQTSVPRDKFTQIEQTIGKALSQATKNAKLDPSFAERIKKSPQTMNLLKQYNITV